MKTTERERTIAREISETWVRSDAGDPPLDVLIARALASARRDALMEAAGVARHSVARWEQGIVERITTSGFTRQEAERFDGIMTMVCKYTESLAAAIEALAKEP